MNLTHQFATSRAAAFFNMSVFYHEEQPRQSKRCKCLATVLKEAFSNCHSFMGRFSDAGPEEDCSIDIDDESEVYLMEAILMIFP